MTVFLGKLLKRYIFNSKMGNFVYLDLYFSRILFTYRQYGTKTFVLLSWKPSKKKYHSKFLKNVFFASPLMT